MSSNSTTKAIVEYLNLNNCFAWRQNNGAVYDIKRQAFRKNKQSMLGVSDIIGIKYDGTFIAIEVKTGEDVLSDKQIYFLSEIERHNGEYYVVKSFDDFLNQFTCTE